MLLKAIFIGAFLLVFDVGLYALLANDVGQLASRHSWVGVAYWGWDLVMSGAVLFYILRRTRTYQRRRKTGAASVRLTAMAKLIVGIMLLIMLVDVSLFELVEHDFAHLASRFPWVATLNRWWDIVATAVLLVFAFVGFRFANRRNGNELPG